jgi:hypothetical protein
MSVFLSFPSAYVLFSIRFRSTLSSLSLSSAFFCRLYLSFPNIFVCILNYFPPSSSASLFRSSLIYVFFFYLIHLLFLRFLFIINFFFISSSSAFSSFLPHFFLIHSVFAFPTHLFPSASFSTSPLLMSSCFSSSSNSSTSPPPPSLPSSPYRLPCGRLILQDPKWLFIYVLLIY